VTRAFERAWEQFIPFLAFPPEVRRVIYTTNSIESLNYQMRKVIKTRGQFPNDAAVVKLLWLAICNIEDRRAAERAQGAQPETLPDSPWTTCGRTVVTNWKKALEQLALVNPDRIEAYL
jgi:putative transposase